MTDIPADIDWVEDICAANLGTGMSAPKKSRLQEIQTSLVYYY